MENKIKGIGYKNYFSNSLNIARKDLEDILRNISSISELEVFPDALVRNLDKDLMEILLKKEINNTNIISLLPPRVFNNLVDKNFNSLNDMQIVRKITPEQIGNYPDIQKLTNILIKSKQIYNLNAKSLNEILLNSKVDNIVDIISATKAKISDLDPKIFSKITGGDINPIVLEQLTAEQAAALTPEFITQLLKDGKLSSLNDEALENINFNFNSYNGAIKNTIKSITFGLFYNNISKEEIFNQLSILKKYDKLHLILKNKELENKDFYEFIDSDNINKFNSEQFSVIFKNINYLKKDTIASIDINNFKEIPNYSLEKINQPLNQEQFIYLFKSNKLQFIRNKEILTDMFKKYDLKIFTDEEIINNLNNIPNCFDLLSKNIIENLNHNIVANIKNNIINSKNFKFLSDKQKETYLKNYKISSDDIYDLNDIITDNMSFDTIINIKKEDIKSLSDDNLNKLLKQNPNIQNYKTNISTIKIQNNNDNIADKVAIYIDNEDFDNLKLNCKKWPENEVLNILENLNFRDNFYGKIHKMEVLNIIISIKENSEKEFKDFIYLLKNTIEEKPETIDGYYTKINFLLKLVERKYFDYDLLEQISDKAIKTVEDCILNCYGIIEKNSINNDLRDLYVKTLLSHANLLAKKYSINDELLVNKNVIDMTAEEIIYLDTIKKAYSFKPDSVTKVKSFLTPILSTLAKSVITYSATKQAGKISGSLATAVGIAGTAIVGKQIYNEVEKARFFSNKKEYHKEQLNKEYSFMGKLQNTFSRFLNYTKKIFSGKSKLDENLDYCKNNIKEESDYYRFNLIKFEEKTTKDLNNTININTIKKFNQKNDENLKKIDNYYNIKIEAIKEKKERKLEQLNVEYPNFKNKDVSFTDLVKGGLSSISDTLTFGNASNPEKEGLIENALRYKNYLQGIKKINKKYEEKINKSREEQVKKYVSTNNEDSKNFEKMLYKSSKITFKIDADTGYLSSLKNFNKKYIKKYYNDITNLMNDNNIDNEIKIKNILLFVDKMNELTENGYYSNSEYQKKIVPLIDYVAKNNNKNFLAKYTKIYTTDNVDKLKSKQQQLNNIKQM